MRKALLVSLVVLVYALHQDLWLWRTARPLLFGAVPAGLAYHAGYSVLAALLMVVLVRFAWPHELERAADAEDQR